MSRDSSGELGGGAGSLDEGDEVRDEGDEGGPDTGACTDARSLVSLCVVCMMTISVDASDELSRDLSGELDGGAGSLDEGDEGRDEEDEGGPDTGACADARSLVSLCVVCLTCVSARWLAQAPVWSN